MRYLDVCAASSGQCYATSHAGDNQYHTKHGAAWILIGHWPANDNHDSSRWTARQYAVRAKSAEHARNDADPADAGNDKRFAFDFGDPAK
jgi:hypothetical protein